MKKPQQIAKMRHSLLAYYNRHGRTLPWRIRPEDRAAGVVADPYAVWLSEIMCQQTTTTAASAYWYKFLSKWPTVQDLAIAQRDDVLSAWAGLGYYARARNLHKCAGIVAHEQGGVFPTAEADLLKLPGIGPYSAAAIAAICADEVTNVVDGNVERVISRIFRVQTPVPKAKPELRALAGTLACIEDDGHPGDYAQALMDLGAHVCKPKNPRCEECPWQNDCAASATGDMTAYPKRAPKTTRPVRYGAVFFIETEGKIWLRQRPDKGLLGGMVELPGTDWTAEKPAVDIWLRDAPIGRNWQEKPTVVKHVFTHFTLNLTVYTSVANTPEIIPKFDIHGDVTQLDDYALPSLMRKAITVALTD